VNAHFDLSTALLSIGEFGEGFREYEWRFYKDEMKGFIATHKEIFSKPMLSKNTYAYKKRVLIHSEQGFGDSIMFARFIPKIKDTFGCKIIFKARDELVELFDGCLEIDEIVARSAAMPEFDYHLPIMSAAFVLGVQTQEEFVSAPYLETKERFFLEQKSKKKRVGVCWSASVTGDSYEEKVFELDSFRPLVESGEYELYSLQVGAASEDIKKYGFSDSIVDLSKELESFAKTAALVCELDFVITCDTSVAHLCGALGVKTYTILQRVPDWRWGVEGESSYMYGSMSLIREERIKDWDSAFTQLYRLLGLKVETYKV
jgi:hypothetical protein